MNNRGQTFFLTFMVGLTIIVVALALAPALKEQTDSTRDVTNDTQIGLDCSNSSISTFNKATCIVTDANLFYFIGGLIFIAGAVITAKVTAA